MGTQPQARSKKANLALVGSALLGAGVGLLVLSATSPATADAKQFLRGTVRFAKVSEQGSSSVPAERMVFSAKDPRPVLFTTQAVFDGPLEERYVRQLLDRRQADALSHRLKREHAEPLRELLAPLHATISVLSAEIDRLQRAAKEVVRDEPESQYLFDGTLTGTEREMAWGRYLELAREASRRKDQVCSESMGRKERFFFLRKERFPELFALTQERFDVLKAVRLESDGFVREAYAKGGLGVLESESK